MVPSAMRRCRVLVDTRKSAAASAIVRSGALGIRQFGACSFWVVKGAVTQSGIGGCANFLAVPLMAFALAGALGGEIATRCIFILKGVMKRHNAQ